MAGRTKKIQVPLGALTGITGTYTKELETTTNQLRLLKAAAAETAGVVAEITPPVPAYNEPHVGYKLKNVKYSGVIATAVPDPIDVYIYATQLGNANITNSNITVETTGKPSAVGEYTVKGIVNQNMVQADTKYYALLRAVCGSSDVVDVRGVMAEFEEVDYSRA